MQSTIIQDISKLENSDIISAKKTIEKEIENLKVLENSLDSSLTKVLNLMQNTQGRIVFTGMGKSGIIGRKIVSSLASTGTPSFFIHPSEASHGDLGMLTKEDVVFAISNSGESKELVDILNYSKRFGIPLIGITKNFKSTLGKACDIVLKLPNAGEACPLGLAPTSSTTATLVLGDILTVALMERKQFTKSDFNQRHPGGKLGSVLQKVSDLMHTNSEIPLLSENSNMKDVLVEMSAKRLGCVGFTNSEGNLSGIFTDGDLRRCLSSDLLNEKAKDVMTKNPKVILPSAMAAEALKIMHDKKITNLFVVENNKPVGVIHIHDLLNSGVA
jgi:arabinose-5-phosphate isomerase